MMQKEGVTPPQQPQPPQAVQPPQVVEQPQQPSSSGGKILDGSDYARQDFSREANPDIFDGVYTRAAYNAIRQTLQDRDTILAGNDANGYNAGYVYAHCIGSEETSRAADAAIGAFSGYHSREQRPVAGSVDEEL